MTTKTRLALASIATCLLIGCGGGGGGGSTSKPIALQSGLIHWWKFNGDAVDAIGTLSSTPIGPVTWTTSPTGQGIVFNGSTTGISLSAVTDMQFQSSFSISAWAKLASYPTNSQIAAKIIFEGDDRPGLDPFDMGVQPDGTFEFLTTGSNEVASVGSNSAFPLNTWVFVTGTYDKVAGIQSLYINGLPENERLSVFNLTPTVPLSNSGFPGIGIGTNNGFPHSAYNQAWNGAISDIRVYNRAITPAEVQALYTNGKAGMP